MKQRLVHRGPDGQGEFYDDTAGLGFAHTRLAILDLSEAGHQPMSTRDGRYTIVYNGEIYNFRELRVDLEKSGATFVSDSDTEVILELFARFGPACLEKLVGMFSFAVWDAVGKRCFLARGPMGIKPLYFWRHGRQLAFASELRAALEADLGPRRLSARALRGCLLHGAVQEPDTLVEQVECLSAGTWMAWQDGQEQRGRIPFLEYGDTLEQCSDAPAIISAALQESVQRHFVSDVPVSLFLSGGIDSTALAAVAKRCGFDRLRTFCISFDEPEFNEGDVAARTAAHFGADHHDWRLTSAEGKGLVGSFLEAFDQPSTDGFNTYCVSKFASQHGAKVVLSGLGGDELFGGYPSFVTAPRLMTWRRRMQLMGSLRGAFGWAVEKMAPKNPWKRVGVILRSDESWAAAYWAVRGIFTPSEADRLVLHYAGSAPQIAPHDRFGENPPYCSDDRACISYLELARYMRNQLLRDTDVMSMAWGLEIRVPFVDRRFIEQLWRTPASERLARGKELLLRAVPEIPEWVACGQKRGFTFPFERWIASEWGGLLQSIDRRSPVALGKWYRRWLLFTLEHFLQANRVDCSYKLCA